MLDAARDRTAGTFRGLAVVGTILWLVLAWSVAPAAGQEGLPETISGSFQLFDDAPESVRSMTGAVSLSRTDEGTTASLRVSGLQPETTYMSHVHEQACARDRGGPHLKFDPEGGDEPPNEIHLGFTTDDRGVGQRTVTNPNVVGADAASVVLHLPDGTKFACADLAAAQAPLGGVAAGAGGTAERSPGLGWLAGALGLVALTGLLAVGLLRRPRATS